VIVFLMNYLSLETLKFLILCLYIMKLNDVHIVSFIILILMPLTIAMCVVVRFNRPLIKAVWCFMRCKWKSNLFWSLPWSCSSPRFWFGYIRRKLQKARMWWSGKLSQIWGGKELTREVAYEKNPWW
jgi:hypothetical protein